MVLLEVTNIKKIYSTRFGGNKVQALSNVTFSVEEGEFVAIMGESGSGKTTLLEETIRRLKAKRPIYVIEGDQQTSNDADRIAALEIPVFQVNTGTGCHLEADMVNHAVKHLNPKEGAILFIENVGNLVCPAEFDTGAVKNAMILSVPEGHDKPLKYPLMFSICDVVLINKIDVMPYFDFDLEQCKKNILMRNPNAKIIPICAKTGEGMEEWADWLKKETAAWREEEHA